MSLYTSKIFILNEVTFFFIFFFLPFPLHFLKNNKQNDYGILYIIEVNLDGQTIYRETLLSVSLIGGREWALFIIKSKYGKDHKVGRGRLMLKI